MPRRARRTREKKWGRIMNAISPKALEELEHNLALLAQAVPAEEITVVLAPGEAPPRQPWPFPLDAVVTILEQPTDAYPLLGEQTTYYVCKNHSCLPPCHQYPS